MSSRLINHARALQEEINNLKQKTHSSAKGHLGIEWTIATLEDRVKEINQQIEDSKRMAYSEFDDEPLDAYDG